VVVGLIEKGEAKKDTSGFVIDLIKARAIAWWYLITKVKNKWRNT
jgi:hypothetical protein